MDIVARLPQDLQVYTLKFIPTPTVSAVDSFLKYVLTWNCFKDAKAKDLKIQTHENTIIDTKIAINIHFVSSTWCVFLITIENSFDFLDKFNQELLEEYLTEEDDYDFVPEKWTDFYDHVFRDCWYNKIYTVYIP
jgi:hypothetical protein